MYRVLKTFLFIFSNMLEYMLKYSAEFKEIESSSIPRKSFKDVSKCLKKIKKYLFTI